MRTTNKVHGELMEARRARKARRAEVKSHPTTDNPAWGFYGTTFKAGGDANALWRETMDILTDADGLFRFEPEVARDLLDSTWGRHLADGMVGMTPSECLHELAANAKWMRSTLKITEAIVLARADTGK